MSTGTNASFTLTHQALHRWLTVGTVLVAAGMLVADQPLKTSQAPLGIISLQLAGSTPAAKQIIREWDSRQRASAAFGLGLDYLFLIVYSAWLYMGCRWATVKWSESGSPYARWMGYLSTSPIIAAILDGIENVILLWFLQSDGRSPFYPIAFGCASLKFLLLGISAVIWIMGTMVRKPIPASVKK